MQLYNKVYLSLIYYIKEILKNNNFNADNVLDGYLDEVDVNRKDVWPTIIISRGKYFGRDVEMGASPYKTTFFMLDVYANSKSQRDDLGDILFDNLNEQIVKIYNFNIFPTTVGDYTGITTSGDMYINSVEVIPVEPPERTNVLGEKYHIIVDGMLNLPNI